MTQLVASPFSFPRKLISILLVSGVLTCVFLFIQTCDFALHLPSRVGASEQGRNATELAIETDQHLYDLIRRHDLSRQVEWAAWSVKSAQNQPEWRSVTRVPVCFQPRQAMVFDLRSRTPFPAQTYRTLHLPSPEGLRPGEFNASSYLFGISTTYERLMENDKAMLRNWQWWLTDGKQDSNGAHLVLMLDRADDQQMQQVESLLESLTISAMVYNIGEPLSTATRYAQLAGELHAYGSALSAVGIAKKWFVLVDDAVFFPSLSHLDETLAAYNARDSIYIGVPSEREDWATTEDGKLTTSGGGVAILSRSGLAKYLSLPCGAEVDSSSESSSWFHSRRWASIIHECMTKRGQLPMHVIPGLYSPTADSEPHHAAGELENGARPIALRSHVRGLDLSSAYLVADECGEACFMQRFLFRDNWVLVNGVSITHYQNPIKVQGKHRLSGSSNSRRELNSQLQLDDVGANRVHLTGGGARNVWKLLDSSVDDYGVVWQAYVKRAFQKKGADEEEVELDSVILLIWTEGKGNDTPR